MQLPRGVDLIITMNLPDQVDPQVEELGDRLKAKWRGPNPAPPEELLSRIGPWSELLDGVLDATYSARYHQRQFLHRLHRISSEEALTKSPEEGAVTIRFNDRPLRAELEALLIKTLAALDALAIYAVRALGRGRKRNSWGALKHLLENDTELRDGLGAGLWAAVRRHTSWVDDAREFRNAIIHEGQFAAFEGVGRRGMLILDARVAGRPAGEAAIEIWKGLRTLSADVANELPVVQL